MPEGNAAQDFWIGLAGVLLVLFVVVLVIKVDQSFEGSTLKNHIVLSLDSNHTDIRLCQEIQISLFASGAHSSELVCSLGETNIGDTYTVTWHDTPGRQYAILVASDSSVSFRLSVWLKSGGSKDYPVDPNSALNPSNHPGATGEISVSVHPANKSLRLNAGNFYRAQTTVEL